MDKFQCLVGSIGKFLVALDLQGGEVEETRSVFLSLLLGNIRNREVRTLHRLEEGFPLFFFRKPPLGSRESRVPIDSLQLPIRLRLEVVDFRLPVDNQGERRRLYPADGKHLAVLPVAKRIEAGRVHPQQPVADGTGKSRLIKPREFRLLFQLLEALADRFLGQGGNPEAVNRTLAARLLHHPALDKLALLPGIAAVDDHLGLLHQGFDDVELLFIRRVADELDTEARGNHRERGKVPRLPTRSVVVRFLQGTEVAERPRNLVAVSLDIPFLFLRSAQDCSDFPCHARLFGNANFHTLYLF